ncbi:MAG: HD domain-containing phosphohydrolase [Candidatus Omnitrophota bacterium]|nr:HD domain-containing protein [Candidatus Omnitrophota bacterium]
MRREKSKYFGYEDRMKKDYEDLERTYREVKGSYSEMIFRLALVAESKDESTGAHLVRIADYSIEIARSLGLPEKDIEIIKYASPMHDIGKIVIPDAILKKPNGLTPEEREIMKKHTVLGANLFKGSKDPLLKAAEVICLSHHERFDGTGYPNGVKGKRIPLFGRIIGIADVFDALTSKRPYKPAYDFDEAIKRIKRESGKHFDPEIVEFFLKDSKKIREIWQATKDIEGFISGKEMLS